MLQLVAKWNVSTPILAILHHLYVLGLYTDGSLFAFARSLPESDIVQQLVHMVIEALFTFLGAPDLNALLHKPLYLFSRGSIAARIISSSKFQAKSVVIQYDSCQMRQKA